MLPNLSCLILCVLIQDVTLASDDDNPSNKVVHASLITLDSTDNNCALKTTNKKYPLK